MGVLLEVCVDSAEGLAAALQGGADRIELCSSLALGGLTPSHGLMRLAAQSSVPVYAMIRPRAGDFCYVADEEKAMLADIDAARQCGLAGVVLGASHRDGTLDRALLTRLKRHAEGLGSTLHRAFDLVPDPAVALETAIDLGFERILTSGCAIKAIDGLAVLQDLAGRARGRISLMPGSGVRPDNVAAIIEATHAFEVHASCSMPAVETNARAIAFGFSQDVIQKTDADRVQAMRRELNRLATQRV
ncbi:copper homeostasis protein CutC [Oryzifoliimicrobium ureilyticus]|uniref:copper homeostasis protein CutC n=1 Tax=Oryzifoliimicrobium ureilyticus TaxID=3113724 RepID=UPI0030765205